MAITKTTANNKNDLMCLSTDTKPTTNVYPNTLLLELDTGKFYYFNGSAWVEVGQSQSRKVSKT